MANLFLEPQHFPGSVRPEWV